MVVSLGHIIGKIKVLLNKKKFSCVDQSKSYYTKDLLNEYSYLIGDHTYGKPRVLHWGEDATLTIGKYCSIADNVTIFLGGNHRIDWVSTYPFNVLSDCFPIAKEITGHPSSKGDVVIGNDVWIGEGVVILSGVSIGDGAVIGTRAVVTKDVPPYAVVVGVPAKIKKYRFPAEYIEKLEKISWWEWSDEKVNLNVKSLCNNDIEKFINENL